MTEIFRAAMTEMHIRVARPDERTVLLALWERSVRATHTFVTDAEIEFYRPLVAKFLRSETMELWLLTGAADLPIGFLALSSHSVEALFLEPAYIRRGGGRRLVDYAQQRCGGALTVDVNEENIAARGFFEALGFRVVARSPFDETGRPHPLLHMRREAPAALDVVL